MIMPLHLKSQNMFDEFLNYFANMTLPYSLDGQSKRLPEKYVLKYICDEDSTFLEYEYKGINADTREVVYVEKHKYFYNAYAKIQLDDLFMLVYDGYAKCEDPEYAGKMLVAIFNSKGDKHDEMVFFAANNEDVDDKTGKILEDSSIEVIIPEMEKRDGKKFFFSIKERYIVNADLAKFELISRDTIR